MPVLAGLVDAVVGVDTHRDTHEVEIALASGALITQCAISNDTAGYVEMLAWIVDHAPGPRLVVSIEGTRSYGRGLARAAPLACWSSSASSPAVRLGAGEASPTRSMRTWLC